MDLSLLDVSSKNISILHRRLWVNEILFFLLLDYPFVRIFCQKWSTRFSRFFKGCSIGDLLFSRNGDGNLCTTFFNKYFYIKLEIFLKIVRNCIMAKINQFTFYLNKNQENCSIWIWWIFKNICSYIATMYNTKVFYK